MGIIIIEEYYNTLQSSASSINDTIIEVLLEFGQDIKCADPTLSELLIENLCHSHVRLSDDDMMFEWYLEYSRRLRRRSRTCSNLYKYINNVCNACAWEIRPNPNSIFYLS
jgi:hypothetical protein